MVWEECSEPRLEIGASTLEVLPKHDPLQSCLQQGCLFPPPFDSTRAAISLL